MHELLDTIEEVFHRANTVPNQDVRALVDNFLDGLEQGLIRCAHRNSDGWIVDARIKMGILLAFRIGEKEKLTVGPFAFIDKDNLPPQKYDLTDGVRVVPGGSAIRRGAYLGQDVVVMPPSYVNVGAYVDDGTMIDSHVLVGSCAQVGRRVHLSAGVQIGGVLEPIGALPVIIEDNAFIGGNCGIFEGCEIGSGAVIGAGVILTKSSKIYDLVNEEIISADDHGVVKVPKDAVVVPGARILSSTFAQKHGLSLATPLIIKYRDQKTSDKSLLEDMLR
jgi:2,3,4,5-tetrahydropyridine-2-carboxylate N-succinyltransferase